MSKPKIRLVDQARNHPEGGPRENPLKIVNVLFHDGHVEQMTLEQMRKLPYNHNDISNFQDKDRTFELGFRKE